jgi:hypothetical protein
VWKIFGENGTHPKYKGDVENGKPNGLGIVTHTDGSKYVGEWKNGGINGQGTFTWYDGGKYVCELKGGIEWNGTYYDKDVKIKDKFVNGKFKNP